jgi:hypothetical protein
LSVSPTTLTFGDESVNGVYPPQTVTVTNRSSVSVRFTGIAISGAGFVQTNTCGTSLTARGTCVISVSYKPARSGRSTGALSLTDNAANSPQAVTLIGKANNGDQH